MQNKLRIERYHPIGCGILRGRPVTAVADYSEAERPIGAGRRAKRSTTQFDTIARDAIQHFRAGDQFVTVDVEGLRVTLFVCYDLRFADEFWAAAPDTDAYLVVPAGATVPGYMFLPKSATGKQPAILYCHWHGGEYTTGKEELINGRKVFPIGMSPGPPNRGTTPTGKDALQELREAGALLFRMSQSGNWNSTVISNQQVALDWAAEQGIYVWLNLRELSKFSATDTTTPASLRDLVNTFKNHPGLGLWKNFDEAWWAGVSAADLQRGYDVIKQEDTNHPVVQTHAPRGTVADLQPYNVAADILALLRSLRP